MSGPLLQMLVVGAGGFAGAIARFALTGFMHRRFPAFLPAGTLLVNVVGCLAIGALMALVVERQIVSETTRLVLITGFLGSLTTFSAFGYETLALLQSGEPRLALWNVAGNLCLGVAAVWLGYAVVKGSV